MSLDAGALPDSTIAETADAHWVGPKPRPLDIVLMLWVGSVGILIAGLQPLLLGGLQDAGRLSLKDVGAAGAIELLTLGAGAAAAAALLAPRHVRWVGCAASLAMMAANLATLACSGGAIVLWRGVAGVAEGVMMWLPALLISRAARPARWEAIFLTVQTLAQLAVAAIAPLLAPHQKTGDVVLWIMTLCAVAAALAALAGPNRLQALAHAPRTTRRGRFDLAAVSGLVCVFAYMAFVVAVWVYAEPIGLHAGLPPIVVGYTSAVSLAAQIVGGVIAAVLTRRTGYLRVLVVAAAVNLGLLAVMGARPTTLAFLTSIAAHGFLWLFIMPYQVLLLIHIDPTRRLAMYASPTQILGSSAGPYVASLFVTDQDPAAALWVAAACIGVSLLALLAVRFVLPK